MLFNSHIFIFVFLPIALAGWFFLNGRKRYGLAQGFLVGMSLWFYAWMNPSHLWILLASCLIGYGLCEWMDRVRGTAAGKAVLAAGCFFHLGTLGYFKYSNFFLENVNAVLRTDFAMVSVILPVGISFYTFQQMAYLIDRWKGEEERCSLLDYLTFMLYFPQILQGPILLGKELIPQLHEEKRRQFDAQRFAEGIRLFVMGLAKKVLLADSLAKPVNFGYENVASLDSISAILLAAGYLTELYFDFSGYCDMAMGLGRMFGIEVAQNFDSPFKSASVKEFWRRWHITLGRFFTRYVYIPLGGSRRGKGRTILNTLIVFTLSGLWHGAAWTFVFWGFLHGIAVAFDSLGALRLPKKWMHQALTFVYVCLAFVFFRASTIGEGFAVLRAMIVPKWNGFLFRMAEALDPSEFYVLTKAASLGAPALLPWINLILLLLLIGICAVVLAAQNAPAIVQEGVYSKKAAFLTACLFAWSVLGMTGVSTYLYFNF